MISKCKDGCCLLRRTWKRSEFRYCSTERRKVAQDVAPACETCCLLPDSDCLDPDCPKPSVVIIGSGIAGLSAAERLSRCGITDLTILEALPKAGGRIKTVYVEDSPVELGATWFWGCGPHNSMYTLACQLGILKPPMNILNMTGLAFDCRGKAIRSQVFHAANKIISDITQEARKKVGTKSDISLWDYFQNKIEDVLKYFPENDKPSAKLVLYGLTILPKFNSGTDLTNVPLNKFGLKKRLLGPDVSTDKGMSSILKPLIKDIGEEKFKYNKIVNKIFWDSNGPGNKRGTIRTCDKSEYYADYIICTLPLGVLKKFHKQLFEPNLPEATVKAINNIGVGAMDSIAVKYKKPFWYPNQTNALICWPKNVMKETKCWTQGIGFILEKTKDHSLLKMIAAGKSGEILGTTSDEKLVHDVTGLLRGFFGDPSIPQPDLVLRSKWSTSNFCLTGITYLGAEGSPQDQLQLGQGGRIARGSGQESRGGETSPCLMFAGEATAPAHQGTLHGARLSGLREADKILTYTKCFCGPPSRNPLTCPI